MRTYLSKRRATRGSTLVLVLLMLPIFLIPLVGLAIDGTMLFIVQAKLSAAADGAVLGAGRLLGTSANTTEIAGEFLSVNFPTGYWGANNLQSNITSTAALGTNTITITASVNVPLLFMRVLGQNYSTVAVNAKATRRNAQVMIVVDRSGSVLLEGANTTIATVLTNFVANSSTSTFVDGRDIVGMVSFGGSWRLDFAPTTNFQTATPNIGTAVNDIAWGSNGTNTADGLYQAWYQLRQLNQPSYLNVILLLTDGRPSGFSGNFTSTANCHTSYPHAGMLQSYVSLGSYPFWPPPTSGADVFGILSTTFHGASGVATTSYNELSYQDANNSGCSYASQIGSAGTNLTSDMPTFPSTAGPVDNVGSIAAYTASGVSTISGYYANPGQSMLNPKSVRYAAFNVADNIATLIRTDTVIKPVLFVIGLTYSGTATEPLDSDWLARISNDPSYVIQNTDADAGTVAGGSIYQSNQTAGWYYQSSQSGLQQAFSNVASQILRLSQ